MPSGRARLPQQPPKRALPNVPVRQLVAGVAQARDVEHDGLGRGGLQLGVPQDGGVDRYPGSASGSGLVGYLDREAAVSYAAVFEELERQGVVVGACPAYLIGGDDVSLGVILCLSSPEAVVGDLRAE